MLSIIFDTNDLLNIYFCKIFKLNMNSETLPYSIKVTAQDIYNAVRRQAKGETILAPKLGESVKLWMKRLENDGWSTLNESTPGEEGRGGYTVAFVSPWQKKVCHSLILPHRLPLINHI